MAKTKARPAGPLAVVRGSVSQLQRQGERVVDRLRHDAQALIARSRAEVAKEVRGLERRLLKGLHAATAERVARLERRITRLEEAIAELRKAAAA